MVVLFFILGLSLITFINWIVSTNVKKHFDLNDDGINALVSCIISFIILLFLSCLLVEKWQDNIAGYIIWEFIFYWINYIIIRRKPRKGENNKEIISQNTLREKKLNYEAYKELKETVENAKKDLNNSGINMNKLDDMLRNGSIKPEDYLDMKNAIQNLETIITLFEPMVLEYEKENNIE